MSEPFRRQSWGENNYETDPVELEPLSDAARAAIPLIQACDGFGPLHIVVADGNVEDGNLDFCETDACLGVHGRDLIDCERACLSALRALPYEQRESAWHAAAYGWENK